MTFSEVARTAQINRATPYQYFETREQLIKATAQRVSDKLLEAVFEQRSAPPMDAADILALNERLLNFGMDNPELCRVWLFEILSSPDPTYDPFWKTYEGYFKIFAQTHLAQENVDTEVLAMVALTSAFLWPIWVNAHAKADDERRDLARRFLVETLRQSLTAA